MPSVLQNKLKQLAKWQKEFQVAKDLVEYHKKEVKEEMEKQGLSKAETDEVEMTISHVTSNRFSSKLFKQDHPDLYEQYRQESESERIKITLK